MDTLTLIQFGVINLLTMKKVILLFTIIILLKGCTFFWVPFNVQEDFTYCYHNKNITGLDSLIKVDGIYFLNNSTSNKNSLSEVAVGDLYPNYVFYENGFCSANVPSIWFLEGETIKSSYIHGSTWGLYRVSGDTIKAQYIPQPGGMSIAKIERWFLIENETSIKQLYLKYHDPITSMEVKKYLKDTLKQFYYLDDFSFVHLDSMPEPQKSWIIKKKWFWCDKEEYKTFKKTRRRE